MSAGTIESLNKAKAMAIENGQLYPDVFRTVLPIVYNDDLALQRWCVDFLVESFTNAGGKLPKKLLVELSVQMLDPILVLLRVKDVLVVQKSIHLLVLSYDLIFLNVLESASAQDTKVHWQKLSDIKQEVIRNLHTSSPLVPLNKQSDAMRSIGCKLQIIQFIGKVAEVQLPTPPKDPRMRRMAAVKQEEDVSISMIPPAHPVLKKGLEAEGQALLDMLFNYINDQTLIVSPLFSAVELVIVKLLKKRPDHVYTKLTNLLMMYESDQKKHSIFDHENAAKVKLIGRFNDRFNKIVIGFMINKKLVKDSNLQQKMSKKFSYVMVRNDAAKKRGILVDSDDEGDGGPAKRRKLDSQVLEQEDSFYNSSPIAKDERYSSLYSLIKPADKISEVDLSTISQEILTNMVVIALKKADRAKLVEGLTIVTERYRELLTRPGVAGVKEEQGGARVFGEGDEDDDAPMMDEIDDLSGVTYDLPLPKQMAFVDKKKHIKRIMGNFVKLARREVPTGPNLSDKLESNQSDLTKVAIPSWNKDSWLVVLTRLASRGLALDGTNDEEEEQLGDIIRGEIFNYFSEDIRNRIDVCIEWLNEEWYSETIKNEKKAEAGEIEQDEIAVTPVYMKWAGKVLDAVILFLEASDRKLFIRLLSDIPYLNKELVWKIKSLCRDPTRFKIGFQSLQFLCIYRPPVKEPSVGLLKELYDESKDQQDQSEDFNKELESLLKKLSPQDLN